MGIKTGVSRAENSQGSLSNRCPLAMPQELIQRREGLNKSKKEITLEESYFNENLGKTFWCINQHLFGTYVQIEMHREAQEIQSFSFHVEFSLV